MRLHIELDDDLIQEVDRVAGPRGRSRFIREAIHYALRHERQKTLLGRTRGAVQGAGEAWQGDPAAWVRQQRRTDEHRAG